MSWARQTWMANDNIFRQHQKNITVFFKKQDNIKSYKMLVFK